MRLLRVLISTLILWSATNCKYGIKEHLGAKENGVTEAEEQTQGRPGNKATLSRSKCWNLKDKLRLT